MDNETHMFHETHTPDKITMEYRELKAETNQVDKFHEDTEQCDWEVFANGDKIMDCLKSFGDYQLRRELQAIHKAAQGERWKSHQ